MLPTSNALQYSMLDNKGGCNMIICPCIQIKALGTYGQILRPVYEISGKPNDLPHQYATTYDDPQGPLLFGTIIFGTIINGNKRCIQSWYNSTNC